MELSKTELLILEQIAKGNKSIKTIALALHKNNKRIYAALKKLNEFVELKRGNLQVKNFLHINLLLQVLLDYPKIIIVIANSGIPILIGILVPSTIQEIKVKTAFQKTIIYNKLKQAKKRNIVIKTGQKFKLNKKIWAKLFDFLIELKKYEDLIDNRTPIGSTIYYKNKEEILFSCREELDAVKTAFSAYEDYGIKILTIKNYYYLPKKKLTKRDILKHSLHIIEKEESINHIIFTALFYAKFRKSFDIQHEILIKINRVLNKEKVGRYPTYREIKDRAQVYNIKV